MTYRPTLYMPLHVQQPDAIQRNLLTFEPIPEETDIPPCDHIATEPQANLFGGFDEVCVACGARV